MEIHRNQYTKDIPSEITQRYPTDLTLYKEIPNEMIYSDYVHKLIDERKLLYTVNENVGKKGYAYFSSDWKEYYMECLKQEGLTDYLKLLFIPNNKLTGDAVERRRVDHLSHYLHLMIACQSETKQNQFIQNECEILRVKFHYGEHLIQDYLSLVNLPFQPLSEKQKMAMKDDLIQAVPRLKENNFLSSDIYAVPITCAVNLVMDLSVLVRNGIVFMPHFDMVYFIEEQYRELLKSQLKVMQEALPIIGDRRILRILVQNEQEKEKRDVNNEIITVGAVDALSKTSFPLCVRNVYNAMKRHHHLKYEGRLMLQHFLKDSNLPIEGCIELFRNEFTKKIDNAKFNKDYMYGIRHVYGLEGGKLKRKGNGCAKIFQLPQPLADEYHGCPFKNWKPDVLKSRLEELSVNSKNVSEITNLASAGHAQLACSKYFEATHNGTPATINHPSIFFDESRKYYRSRQTNTNTNSSQSES